MPKYDIIIQDGFIVNDGVIISGDIGIKDQRIEKIGDCGRDSASQYIQAQGNYIIPGIIDDQVHFRDPGWPDKGTIYSESRAAAAGGVTSFMEMPNTQPQAVTHELLEEKYNNAQRNSLVNYSFYLGATNNNLDEVKKTNSETICGIKIFMGSSTGNMLVDQSAALEDIFREAPTILTTHCEDEATIIKNKERYDSIYSDMDASFHPLIRDHKGCVISSQKAIQLANRYHSRLHILHISTAEECGFFESGFDISQKKISSEACVHHMYFNDSYYHSLGNKIKCNPAIKTEKDRVAILNAFKEGRINVIATDHAPHTIEEKSLKYTQAPSGLPLVQHGLSLMLSHYHQKQLSMTEIVRGMCHAPADCFRVIDRGYLREGYYADIAIVDAYKKYTVTKNNLLYKCGWSPLENMEFTGKVECTMVNGKIVYQDNHIIESKSVAQRLKFRKY